MVTLPGSVSCQTVNSDVCMLKSEQASSRESMHYSQDVTQAYLKPRNDSAGPEFHAFVCFNKVTLLQLSCSRGVSVAVTTGPLPKPNPLLSNLWLHKTDTPGPDGGRSGFKKILFICARSQKDRMKPGFCESWSPVTECENSSHFFFECKVINPENIWMYEQILSVMPRLPTLSSSMLGLIEVILTSTGSCSRYVGCVHKLLRMPDCDMTNNCS